MHVLQVNRSVIGTAEGLKLQLCSECHGILVLRVELLSVDLSRIVPQFCINYSTCLQGNLQMKCYNKNVSLSDVLNILCLFYDDI